jgi:chloramphenicol 3-O phosphotransferase
LLNYAIIGHLAAIDLFSFFIYGGSRYMNPGKIIIINGTSSSGKTSLLYALQNILEEPYLEAGIDKFIFMMPERYLERPWWDDVIGLADRAGETGHRLFRGMHRAVAALSLAGMHVLVDHVLVEPAWVQDCRETFQGLPVFMIGVHCPLEVVEQREYSRRNRTLGKARLQFERVHAYCCYDFEMDTSTCDAEQCALQIKDWLDSDPTPGALFR